MATFRKRGGKWQVQVRRKGAPPASKSFLLRSDAVRWAQQMEAQADRLAPHREGKIPLAPPAPVVTVQDLIDHYKTLKAPSTETIRILDTQIAPAFGPRDPATLRTHEVATWHQGMTKTVKMRDASGKVIRIEQEPALQAADKALDMVKALLNFGMKKEFTPFGRNPCSGVDRHLSARETIRHYAWTDAEIARLGAVLKHYEQMARAEGPPTTDGIKQGVNVRGDDGRLIGHYPSLWAVIAIRFIALLGLRKNEALKLKWEQIDFDAKTITWGKRVRGVQRSKHKTARQSGIMVKAITPPVEELLEQLTALRVVGNPFVFVGADRMSHLTDLKRAWPRIRAEAKLRKPDGEWARVHDLRHWYGDEADAAGMEEKHIMQLMGHSSVDASRRYAQGYKHNLKARADVVALIMAAKLGA